MKNYWKGMKKIFFKIKNTIIKFYSFSYINILRIKYYFIFKKYKEFTMIPRDFYVENLFLCKKYEKLKGCVVECGSWKGGMIAGFAELLGDQRFYYLFDSFEGLPDAKKIDGERAISWQNNKESISYLDNCSTDMKYAKKAMDKTNAKNYKIIKGWFSQVLPNFTPNEPIAILRLDGDWYDSTMDCLNFLYKHVIDGGLIIIDDYYAWDGCAKAVNDFLSNNKLSDRIITFNNKVCYIIKNKNIKYT